MIKKLPLALIPMMLLGTTIANTAELKPLVQFGYDFGGKTLATVEQFNYYTGYDSSKIRAGQGLSFEAGAAIASPKSDLEMQFLVGYHIDRESASNGSVTWDKIPFTGLAVLKQDRWRFGGGVTYHLNPELSGSFSGYDSTNTYFNDSVNDKYKNSVGAVLQVQYMMSDASAIGVKGTLIDYKLKSNSNIKVNGNSIGVHLSYAFGQESSFN